jgi:hypothetical protein
MRAAGWTSTVAIAACALFASCSSSSDPDEGAQSQTPRTSSTTTTTVAPTTTTTASTTTEPAGPPIAEYQNDQGVTFTVTDIHIAPAAENPCIAALGADGNYDGTCLVITARLVVPPGAPHGFANIDYYRDPSGKLASNPLGCFTDGETTCSAYFASVDPGGIATGRVGDGEPGTRYFSIRVPDKVPIAA